MKFEFIFLSPLTCFTGDAQVGFSASSENLVDTDIYDWPTNFFLRILWSAFHSFINSLCWTLCLFLAQARCVLRGDLLSFYSSYTIWVTPWRPSVRRLLGLLQAFLLPFQAIIYHFHSPPELRTRRLGCTTNSIRTKQLRAQVLSRWLVHL